MKKAESSQRASAFLFYRPPSFTFSNVATTNNSHIIYKMFLVSFVQKCYNLIENTERIPYKVNKSNKSEVIHYDGKTQSNA